MSGNGRGAARNPSKSPPFLIIGLLVALAILGFNYWNLSSSNGSLSATNMDLQDQIRILTSKRLNEEQSKRDIERKYQLIEQRIATKDSEIKKLQEDVDKKGGDVERAENSKKECETNLQQCETNNSGIQSQLSAVKDEVDKLKSQPAAASTQNCDSQCREQVKKLYSEMFQKVGAAPMQQLINSGIDIGEDLKIQVQQAAGAGGQKQIQPPNAGEQPGQQQQPAQEQPAQQQTAKELEAEKEGSEGQGKNSAPTTGLVNSLVGLKDKLKEGVQSLSQETIKQGLETLKEKTDLNNIAQDKVKEGLQSLSEKAGQHLHEILNQTQEGIKQGLKKSQEIAGLIYGGEGKLHDSSNKTQDISENKNNTVVGKDNLLQPNTKVNGTNQEKGQNKTEGENAQKSAGEANVKEMEQGSKKAGGEVKTTESSKTVQGQKDGVQNEKENVAKTVKDDDAGYDDEDDGKDTGDKVEANKNMKFSPKKTDDDSIDALRRNLNTQ
ncbi:protein GOLM2-like isoform X1 [Mytilus californianus]|uniref:protein GOLM2-like isoform X1 n=1 Tax=Mytilus californianus TaxID=6549 RepID=UPI0022476DD9|nr:protein GOLM2-like isoform X1 [Mytilus californianus]